MALVFNWDLWHDGGFGKWGPPERTGQLWVDRRREKMIAVMGGGRWESKDPRPLYWLEVYGTLEELAELDDQTLIDLVKVRYGFGI